MSTVESLNREIDTLDHQIALLRAKKRTLATERASLIESQEIRIKLQGLTKEQRQRIVLRPGTADAKISALLEDN